MCISLLCYFLHLREEEGDEERKEEGGGGKKRAEHRSGLGASSPGKKQAYTHLVHRGVILPIGDVISNGACKQHRLLTDQTNVSAVPRRVQVSQVVSTYTPQEQQMKPTLLALVSSPDPLQHWRRVWEREFISL